jgi:hypothetical protein
MTGSRADSVPVLADDDETALRAFAAVSALGPWFVAAPVPDMGRVSWAALIDEPRVLQGKGVRGDGLSGRSRSAGRGVEGGRLDRRPGAGRPAALSPLLGATLVSGLLPVTAVVGPQPVRGHARSSVVGGEAAAGQQRGTTEDRQRSGADQAGVLDTAGGTGTGLDAGLRPARTPARHAGGRDGPAKLVTNAGPNVRSRRRRAAADRRTSLRHGQRPGGVWPPMNGGRWSSGGGRPPPGTVARACRIPVNGHQGDVRRP